MPCDINPSEEADFRESLGYPHTGDLSMAYSSRGSTGARRLVRGVG